MGEEKQPVISEAEPSATVAAIIGSAAEDLKHQNQKALELLVHLAEQGFFTEHQTQGALDRVADELLSTVTQGGGGDED